MPSPVKYVTKQDVKRFWEQNPLGLKESAMVVGEIGTLDFFNHVEHRRYIREWQILTFVPFVNAKGLRVVEVGCGMGTDGIQWSRAGAKYTGLDLTREAVRIASQRFNLFDLPGKFVEADAENLPIPDNSVEYVYSYGVLHHTPDTIQTIKEIHRILKPGGSAIIMLYHKYSLQSLIIFLWGLCFYLLRFDPFVKIVHWITHKPLERLREHQSYLRDERYFFMDGAYARYTDGWETPVSKAYSRKDVRLLFRQFCDVRTFACFVPQIGSLRRYFGKRVANGLEYVIGYFVGWHLFIFARK